MIFHFLHRRDLHFSQIIHIELHFFLNVTFMPPPYYLEEHCLALRHQASLNLHFSINEHRDTNFIVLAYLP